MLKLKTKLLLRVGARHATSSKNQAETLKAGMFQVSLIFHLTATSCTALLHPKILSELKTTTIKNNNPLSAKGKWGKPDE